MFPRRDEQSAAARPAPARTKLFISYSRRDEAAVVRLAEALETDAGIEVFRDKRDILPAEAWSDRLAALILKADAIVLCVSPDSMQSQVVAWEIDSALAASKRIVPVVIRDTPAETLPATVAKLNFIFLRGQDAFDQGLAQLRAAVQTDIGWVREHTRLGELARRWVDDGRRAGDMLRGPALDLAERWLSLQPRQAPAATDFHRDFISASRHGATRRQQGWIFGSAVVAAVSIGLSILAYWQRNKAAAQRTEANAQRLVAEARAVLADAAAPGERATRMLLASLSLRPSDEARKALKLSVDRLEPLAVAALPWPASADALTSNPRFSPDGAWLTAATSAAWLIWSTKTHELRVHHAADLGDAPGKIVFAPNGRHAAMLIGGDEPDAPVHRVLLADLVDAAVTEPRIGRAMDLAALGDHLVALIAGRSTKRVRVIDLVSGKALWQSSLPHRVRLGRLVRRSAEAAASAADPPDIVSMLTRGAPRLEDIVLAEEDGRVSLWQLDQPALLHALSLPVEAALLAIGELGRVMAVRMGDESLAVLDVRTGEAQWRGAAGATLRFVGGDRFVITPGPRGVRLQSIVGGVDVELEHARRSDWDGAAIGNVERYSAIIDAASSDDGSVLATAWKDGRVDVWRPGLKPRYGTAFAAIPVANFEPVARFDHGAELGPTVTWTSPPVLFVSPNGRFVGSQSMGMRTTPVGGLISVHPAVRIWDTWKGGETARFHRLGGMALAFSPRDDLLASFTVPPPIQKDAAPRLELWRLSPPQPEVHREEALFELPVSPSSATPAPAEPMGFSPVTTGMAETVWVGVDRRLRMLDTRTGLVQVLDDLGPAACAAFTANRHAAQALMTDTDAAFRAAFGSLDAGGDPYERFAAQFAGLPPETPVSLYPVAVSADRRRAVVKLGATLRIYALDTKRLVRAERIEDDIVLGAMGVPFPEQLLLSCGGETVASTQVTRGDVRALLETMRAARERPDSPRAATQPTVLTRHVLLLSLERRAAPASIEQKIEVWPLPSAGSPMTPSSRLVAVSRDGRLLVQERQRVVPAEGGPPSVEGRFAVVQVRTQAVCFETPPWTAPVGPLGAVVDSLRAAAFSPSGRRLLIDETGSACPSKLDITPALLPVRVPIGPDLRTTLTLWDLSTGKVLHELAYEHVPLKAPGGRAQPLSPIAGTLGAMNGSRPASIGLSDETTAVRTVVDLLPSMNPERMALRVTAERIPLDRADNLSGTACARLPAGQRAISETEWARWAPGEKPRAICGQA